MLVPELRCLEMPCVGMSPLEIPVPRHHQPSRARPTAGVPAGLAVAITLVLGGWSRGQTPQSLEVEIPSGRFVGLPVHWGRHEAVLLEPSGRFHNFPLTQLRQHRLLKQTFAPQSLPEARSWLQAELGSEFETLIWGPYVLATPSGQSQRWQARFAALLAGYQRYFEVRGWPLQKPDFPLTVIVFPNRQGFLRYASGETPYVPDNVVGSYFPKSNRCVLYQTDGSHGKETEATIVHEAVHQLAYNTGIHERLSENPLWFVEGLATMFERPAVYDLRASRSTIAGRMLPDQVARLQPLLADSVKLESQIRSLITSDAMFRQNPSEAYALAWALTFYLAERMPNEYRHYVELQNRRRFGAYTAGERQRDFREAVSADISLLTIQMGRLFAK